MAYDPKILHRATARLAQQKQFREARREALRERLYAQEPRLAQLDRQLQGTMADLVAASLRRGQRAGDAVRAVRDKNLDLQRERAVLLGAMGLPADALDDKPACPYCGDTGWRGAQMCDCLKKLCAQEQIQDLSKVLDLGGQSFDTFCLDYYSNVIWPNIGNSPRANMDLVYEVCLNYAQKFGRFHIKNLFLTGAPGLGKTFLSACIARSVSEQGFSVVYDTAETVLRRFETWKFQWDRPENDVQVASEDVNRYLNCDLLILDDLGSEYVSPLRRTLLYELLNTRLVNSRQMVISSNLTLSQVGERYSPAIASRLTGEFYTLSFFGEDIRPKKKAELARRP